MSGTTITAQDLTSLKVSQMYIKSGYTAYNANYSYLFLTDDFLFDIMFDI